MNLNELEHFPRFLHSYEEMIQHFDEQLGDLSDTKKGEYFEKFALNIIPYSNLGNDFEYPKRVKKEQEHQSRDDGADLIANSFDSKKTLCIQASYKIYKADTLDTKINRLIDFSNKLETQENLDGRRSYKDSNSPIIPGLVIPGEENLREFHYALVTLNNIDGIIKSFENRHREMYDQLKQSNRLHIIHGNGILNILRNAYRKSFTIPTSVTLELKEGPLFVENSIGKVYIGVVAGTELKKCYDEHGESIFFENIREFLGPKSGKKQEDREGVNRAIEKTISDESETMLAKNNGVAFRAEKVTVTGEKILCLEKASIVNGCQTTMSLVKNPKEEAHVLVKVVEINSGSSWDIAKSSNYQNPVDLIQLDLAKFIRHQVVKKASIHQDFALEGVNSAPVLVMMDSINQESGKYQAIYSLFIGFFSLLPNNTVSNLYTKLRGEVLEDFYNDPSREKIFRVLAKLDQESNQGVEEIKKIYICDDLDDSSLTQRFLDLQKDNYRALLTILAACTCLGKNIYDPISNYEEISGFLAEVERMLDAVENRWSFIDYFTWSFQSLVNVTDATKNRNENSKDLSNRVSRVKFENLYDDVRRLASIDAARSKRKSKRIQELPEKN